MYFNNSFREALRDLIKTHLIDSKLNTPDYIIANYILDTLNTFSHLQDAITNYNEGDTLYEERDNLDGDLATGLASAGFGTDEDYSSGEYI